MASAEQVQGMIDTALNAYEQRLQSQVANFVNAKLDEHTEEVGRLAETGRVMVEALKEQTFFLTKAAQDAQYRADAIIANMNTTSADLEKSHGILTGYVDDLKKSTSDALNDIVGKFNAEGVAAKEDIENVKKVIESVAEDGASKLESQISEVYAWSVRFMNDVKA